MVGEDYVVLCETFLHGRRRGDNEDLSRSEVEEDD